MSQIGLLLLLLLHVAAKVIAFGSCAAAATFAHYPCVIRCCCSIEISVAIYLAAQLPKAITYCYVLVFFVAVRCSNASNRISSNGSSSNYACV